MADTTTARIDHESEARRRFLEAIRLSRAQEMDKAAFLLDTQTKLAKSRAKVQQARQAEREAQAREPEERAEQPPRQPVGIDTGSQLTNLDRDVAARIADIVSGGAGVQRAGGGGTTTTTSTQQQGTTTFQGTFVPTPFGGDVRTTQTRQLTPREMGLVTPEVRARLHLSELATERQRRDAMVSSMVAQGQPVTVAMRMADAYQRGDTDALAALEKQSPGLARRAMEADIAQSEAAAAASRAQTAYMAQLGRLRGLEADQIAGELAARPYSTIGGFSPISRSNLTDNQLFDQLTDIGTDKEKFAALPPLQATYLQRTGQLWLVQEGGPLPLLGDKGTKPVAMSEVLRAFAIMDDRVPEASDTDVREAVSLLKKVGFGDPRRQVTIDPDDPNRALLTWVKAIARAQSEAERGLGQPIPNFGRSEGLDPTIEEVTGSRQPDLTTPKIEAPPESIPELIRERLLEDPGVAKIAAWRQALLRGSSRTQAAARSGGQYLAAARQRLATMDVNDIFNKGGSIIADEFRKHARKVEGDRLAQEALLAELTESVADLPISARSVANLKLRGDRKLYEGIFGKERVRRLFGETVFQFGK